MENKKATTLAQRFGFQDPELKTPKHDELMIWLDENVEQLIVQNKYVLEGMKSLSVQEIGDWTYSDLKPLSTKQLDEYAEKIAGLPLGAIETNLTHKIWEQPIMNGSYMVGFSDMHIRYEISAINARVYIADRQKMSGYHMKRQYWAWYEIKPSILSAGEVIRQIRMYQQFTKIVYEDTFLRQINLGWFIVSPDTRFRSVIEGQGIGFINPSEYEQKGLFE